MPEEDVSDLRDVFDAINKLCDTMRTSTYEDAENTEQELDDVTEIEESVQIIEPVKIANIIECDKELASPAEVGVRIVDAYRAEQWNDALVSPPMEEDIEQVLANAEPVSEMYYTASSEISLLSEGEIPEKSVDEDAVPREQEDKETRKGCVMSGHVAAMRERFENMTRTNTPCPELTTSTSPDALTSTTLSPDVLG